MSSFRLFAAFLWLALLTARLPAADLINGRPEEPPDGGANGAPADLEKVSPRLKATLVHPARKGLLFGLKYSLDGKWIVAGTYPAPGRNGTIQSWDAQTGKELAKTEIAPQGLLSVPCYAITRDCRMAFVLLQSERKSVRIKKNGKQLRRWEFSDSVQAWDLASSKVLHTFKHSPQRHILSMELAPDGANLATYEELPGEAPDQPTRTSTIWEIASGEALTLPSGVEPLVFSPDGKTLAAASIDGSGFVTAVRMFDVAMAKETQSLPVILRHERDAYFGLGAFSPDSKTFVGEALSPTHGGRWLKFWNATTGREKSSTEAEANGPFHVMTFSPDSRTLAVTNLPHGVPSKLVLFEVASGKQSKTVILGEKTFAIDLAYSPDGKWIAAAMISDDLLLKDAPQPRIILIDAANAKVSETIVAPPSLFIRLCFSPDGKTLASTGDGSVLLWNLTNPPLGTERENDKR